MKFPGQREAFTYIHAGWLNVWYNDNIDERSVCSDRKLEIRQADQILTSASARIII